MKKKRVGNQMWECSRRDKREVTNKEMERAKLYYFSYNLLHPF
jgi:hypothetical protein